jgi:peptidoglycan/xylan/chitin deacetylase (PgdA/CDA1 family)
MKTKRRVILSFDVDGERAFNSFDKKIDDIFLTKGVPAITHFLEENGLDATFFTVGKNIEDMPEIHSLLRNFEIGNHTYSHPRYLTRMTGEEKAYEIKKGHEVITGFFRQSPGMFRAPDYQIDHEMFDILKGLGYLGDSSVIRVLLPFRYFMNHMKHRDLSREKMEIPLTSFIIPFNGTSVISFGMTYARIVFNILLRFRRTIVLNFHPRDFVNIDIPETGFMNRKRSLETSLAFLTYIKEKCDILSFRQFLGDPDAGKREKQI